jgi:hypothetical protein
MAPVFQLRTGIVRSIETAIYTVESAWETQASWRHGRFGAKSAPQHRDFAPEKVGTDN